MKRELRFLPEAEEELLSAASWYERRRSGLGVDLVAAVDAAVDRIVEAPLSHPLWVSGLPYRRLTLRRFPFIVFFTVDETAVRVIAIAHAKRQPGYWMGRDAAV